MKNKLILGAALLVAAVTETLACTNFIVGKNAFGTDKGSPPNLQCDWKHE